MEMIECKLNKIGRFINGANFTPDQLGTGTKFVNLDDVYKEKDLRSSDSFEYVKLKNEETYILRNGDILFVRSSVKPSGVGYPCLFLTDSDDKVVFCGFLIRFRFDQSIVLPKYLLYQLLLPENRNKVVARGQVVANTNINQRGIGSLSIRLHKSKPEQTAIATILSKVDEAIAATQKSIQAAEKLKKALMQNLLTGKLKPDGSWRTEDEFYEDEKFGKVPKGWEVKSVDELVNRKTDTIDPVKSTEIFDYVGLEHIAQGEFVRIGKGKSDETLALKVIFEKGDLLYGKLRPYLNKVWVADISGVGSTEFLVFEKNEFTEWVYLNFQTKRFLDFTLSMTAGTQHPRAGWRDVKRFLIIKPSEYSELQLISNKILATEKDKLSKQTKIQTLQRLKKSLMQNLLTGKVRLPQEFIAQFENEVAEPKPIETEN